MTRTNSTAYAIDDHSMSRPNVTISVSFGDKTCHSILQTSIPVSKDLKSFLRPGHLRLCERFDQFRLVAGNRIEANLGLVRQAYVEERISEVAQTLRFMDLTGLEPTAKEICNSETYSKDQRLPGQDHVTTWLY